MGIFGKKRTKQMQAMVQEISTLKAKVEFQALVIDDVTTVTERDKKYKGNLYGSYDVAVSELTAKYQGTSDWGVLQTGNIVDIRAAFIAGGGLKIFPKREKEKMREAAADENPLKPAVKEEDPAQNEMDFIAAFIEHNNLDHEMVQEYAISAELEGRFLGELFWDDDMEMVSLRFRSWKDYKYVIETAPKDYAKYLKATWVEGDEEKELIAENFVYVRFSGRINEPNKPYPKIAKCLTQIEDIDKALRDWREINRLFAAPKPDFEFETVEQAKKAQPEIDKMNFKIKQAFVHTGKFSYVAPTMEGVKSLENEILTKAKIISGTTGIPIQFLGMPDLTSIRASSSENLEEVISATTQKERIIWIGFYQEAIKKAMAIWVAKTSKTKLDSNKLQVHIPHITQEQWTRVKDVWMPLWDAGAIRHETLLEQLPDIDIDAEVEAKERRTTLTLERFRPDSSDDGDGDGDEDEEGDRHNIKTGERGGKYYVDSEGKKIYVTQED